jgi:hypothetical protein
VRDVAYDEDRLPEQMIGHRLSRIRNVAIMLLRQMDDQSILDA